MDRRPVRFPRPSRRLPGADGHAAAPLGVAFAGEAWTLRSMMPSVHTTAARRLR
jgi:hypothetical protein